MLDLNRAFGDNALQLNPQLETSAMLGSQPSTTFSAMNFTDLLASVRAQSENTQSGTESGRATAQPFQSATSLPSYRPPISTPGYQDAPVSNSAPTYKNSDVQQGSAPIQAASADDDGSAKQVPASDKAVPVRRAVSSSTIAPKNETSTADPANTSDAPEGLTDECIPNNASTSLQPGPQQVISHAATAPPPAPQPASQPTAKQETNAATQQTTSASGGGSVMSATRGPSLPKPSDPLVPQTVQQALVSPSSLVSGKSADKSKANKEIAMADSKSPVAAGMSGTVADSVIVQAQTVTVTTNSTSVAAVAAADAGANTAELAPKNRAPNKLDSTSGLAFAVKIQNESPIVNLSSQAGASVGMDFSDSDAAASNTQANVSAFSSQLTGILSLSGPKPALKSGSTEESAASGLLPLTIVSSPGSGPSTADADDDIAPTEEVAATTAVAEDQPASSQPVKTVQVQITGADDQKVDLKFVEKSGSLTMSVRSADGSLTKALQQNLPDLSTRLNDQQIRAEWWRPEAQPSDTAKNSGSPSSGTNDSANQDQGNRDKGDSGQHNGRHNPQPDWVEEHAMSNKSNKNGTQFSWQL